MPRYIMGQNPISTEDKEKALLSLALKYLRGGITLAPDSPVNTFQHDELSDSLEFGVYNISINQMLFNFDSPHTENHMCRF